MAQQDTIVHSINRVELVYTAREINRVDSTTMAILKSKTVAEILNYQPGVFINETTGNSGAPLLYSINGSRAKDVAVLLNDIPINDASQISTFTDFRLIRHNTQSGIQLKTGGHSVAHGANAAAGVIGLWNKATVPKPFAEVNMEAGKWNTFKQSWSTGGNSLGSKLHYGGTMVFHTTNGFSAAKDTLNSSPSFDKDATRSYNFNLYTSYFSDRVEAPLRFYFNGQNLDFDQAAFTDGDDNLRNSTIILQFSPKVDLNGVLLQIKSQIQENTRIQAAETGGEHSRFKAFSKYVDVHADIDKLSKLSISPGLTYTHAKTNQYGKDFIARKYQRQIAVDTANYNTIEPYLMLTYRPIKDVSIDAGTRYTYHSNFGGEVNYEAAAAYRWLATDTWQSHISVETASAYVTPSLFQLYSSFGKKGLAPETSTSYQATLKIAYKDIVRTKINAFYRIEQNPIVFSNQTFRYANGGNSSFAKGLNISTEIIPNEHIWGKAFVNMVDRKRYQEMYRLPKLEIGAIANLQPKPIPSFSFTADYRWVGERIMPLFNNSTFEVDEFDVEGYHALNFTANYTFDNKQWNAYVVARNVPDQDFIENLGYNTEDFNMKVGVNYNFKP